MSKDHVTAVVLVLVVIALKWSGSVTWSWWIVLAPIWGMFVLGIAIGLIQKISGYDR